MPLTIRDINANMQRDLPRTNKRHSLRQADQSYSHLKDENSPPPSIPSPKNIPPSQRILSATKASTAKVAIRTPPSNRGNSRLPRRTPPPQKPPIVSKWTTRVAERIESTEKAAQQGLQISTRATNMPPPPPVDKPLPSRPVAAFVSALSPTKDGRGLVDAVELPLTINVGGNRHEWPTLVPRTASSQSTVAVSDGSPVSARQRTLSNRAASMMAAATTLTQVIVGGSPDKAVTEQGTSERSSSSTFISAKDTRAIDDGTDSSSSGTSIITPHHQQELPDRRESLRTRISNGCIIASQNGSLGRAAGLEDSSATSSSVLTEIRSYSPSIASFSRPRPSSSSLNPPATYPPALANTAVPVKSQRTASRIPLPDAKKATLVDIRSRRSSGVSTATAKVDAPSFGSRRLDAPDALRILDQGIKRRQRTQVQRYSSCSSQGRSPANSPHDLERGLNTADCKISSPEEGTSGRSSSDEEELRTPMERPPTYAAPYVEGELDYQPTDSFYQKTAHKLFDGAVNALSKATPPTTSQHTAPLQTIPSQAILPFHTDADDEVSDLPAISRRLSKLTKRLSDLYVAHAAHTDTHGSEKVPEDTRNSLISILNNYEMEDARFSDDGNSHFDPETKKHITSTLSLLEGKGNPPRTDVDNETLLYLFGHLRRGLGRTPTTASFTENAAAAEKFLARDVDVLRDRSIDRYPKIAGAQAPAPAKSPSATHGAQLGLVASKWSNSTSSITGLATEEVSPRTANPVKIKAPKLPRLSLQTRGDNFRSIDSPKSIGFPSRIPGKPDDRGVNIATPPSDILRRPSPSHSGVQQPGSVRTARATIQQVRGNFQRTTASAQSKKAAKYPTPNTKSLRLSSLNGQRGRVASGEKDSRVRSEGPTRPQTPRARSRSRYVIDKIGGLFSGKRERKTTPAPPVPAVEKRYTIEDCNIPSFGSNGSPVMKAPKLALVPKMPSMSPSLFPALRSESQATSSTSIDTPVDSVAGNDSGLAIQGLTERLVHNARRETMPARKERLLNFAQVLNDSLISAREAQMSAETAWECAARAQLSWEMTQKSLAMLHRLAVTMSSRK